MTQEDKKGLDGAMHFIASVSRANGTANVCLCECNNQFAAEVAGSSRQIGELLFSAAQERGDMGKTFKAAILECTAHLIIGEPDNLDLVLGILEEMQGEIKKAAQRNRRRRKKKEGE